MKDNTTATPTTFGELLRALRTARGIGLVEMAHRVGIDPGLLSRVETGKRKPTSTGMIDRLLEALGIKEDSDEHRALLRLAGFMTRDEMWQAIVEAGTSHEPPTTPKDLSDSATVRCANLADLVGQATVWAVGHGATVITVRASDGSVQRFHLLAEQKSTKGGKRLSTGRRTRE